MPSECRKKVPPSSLKPAFVLKPKFQSKELPKKALPFTLRRATVNTALQGPVSLIELVLFARRLAFAPLRPPLITPKTLVRRGSPLGPPLLNLRIRQPRVLALPRGFFLPSFRILLLSRTRLLAI